MRTDRSKDGHDEANSAFHNFANAPKNWTQIMESAFRLLIEHVINNKFNLI
jgi:dihydroneopterin aldolase